MSLAVISWEMCILSMDTMAPSIDSWGVASTIFDPEMVAPLSLILSNTVVPVSSVHTPDLGILRDRFVLMSCLKSLQGTVIDKDVSLFQYHGLNHMSHSSLELSRGVCVTLRQCSLP